jgi:hypothetical protein
VAFERLDVNGPPRSQVLGRLVLFTDGSPFSVFEFVLPERRSLPCPIPIVSRKIMLVAPAARTANGFYDRCRF